MAISALNHDGQLWISLGRSRKETSWQSRQVAWSQLLKRFSETSRTNETYKEYMSMSKDLQSEKKDVGGFVGGVITGSGGAGAQRLKKNIATRSMITLDIDYLTNDFWGTYEMLFDNAAALYSTHKHSPESPRLRLIMPLDRPYFPDQYEAISRKVAELLNIECFDDSTFQRERLMYWPSTSKDGVFQFQYQDGPFLIGTEMLRRYYDWKDTSQWPISSRVSAEHRQLADKQGDPMEKPGVIGAFCRAYSISEAIDLFLGDTYTSTAQENRYTYVHGSTAGGLILYDDKFAYSHHGTDPVSGRLVNAFDLVRLHRYGNEDERTRPDTPINKMPSFDSMRRFCEQDQTVRKQYAVARLAELKKSFGDFEETELKDMEDEEPETDDKWKGQLEFTKNGFSCTAANVLIILRNDPKLKGCFAYNSFLDRAVAMRNMPWRNINRQQDPLCDEDDACLRIYLEKGYKISGREKITDAVMAHLLENRYHPVCEYLTGLTWDGRKRIDTLLIDYFGAEDSPYVRTVTRKTIVAAVNRVFKPGCKFDNVLTLISDEGKNKSSFLEKIGTPWFSADFGPLDNMVRAMEQIQGSWIIEIAELAAIRKSDMETVKHFISKTEDRFRKAFGRRTSFCPRQSIFIATSNKRDFIAEAGRHRRFWPVTLTVAEPMKDVWKDLTVGEVRQIWAEAVELYKNKETLHLSKEIDAEAIKVKNQHIETDDREMEILQYLETEVPEEWDTMTTQNRKLFLTQLGEKTGGAGKMQKISPIQIWAECFNRPVADASPRNMKFIKNTLDKLENWERKRIRTREHGLQWGYWRKEEESVDFDF